MIQLISRVFALFAAAWLIPFNSAAQQPSFLLGVCNHLAHGRSNAQQSMQAMTALQVNTFRDDVFWGRVEAEKNVYSWPKRLQELERAVDLAKERGIEPVLILGFENPLHHEGRYPISDEAQAAYARFAEYVVGKFKGRVRYYEVGNEWNQKKGTAEDYTRLLKRAYPAIKRADPNSIVLGGAVEGAGPPKFIRTMMDNGALAFMDGLSVHPYVFWRGPTGTPAAMHQWMVDLQKMLHQYSSGRDVPLYITEIGWPNDNGSLGVTEQQTADYLAQMVFMMRSLPYVKGIWWYNLFNKGKDPKEREHNFGLMTEDAQLKPAFNAFEQVSQLARQSTFVRRENAPPGVWALRFANAQGEETLAVFNTQTQAVTAQSTGAAVNKIDGKANKAQMLQAAAGESKPTLNLSATPVLIRGSKNTPPGITFSGVIAQ
jgi:polysaccharide biosynthesis protein PslG